MNPVKKEKIDFMSRSNFFLINYSERMLALMLLISLVAGIAVFRFVMERASLQEELVVLSGMRQTLTGADSAYTSLREQKTLPHSNFDAAINTLHLLEGRGEVGELSFAYPHLLVEGRAYGEAYLQEIILRTFEKQGEELEITLLRLDYSPEPSFRLEIVCGGEGGVADSE